MRKMMELSPRLRSEDEGAAMIEYGLLVALIALVCIAAAAIIGTDLNAGFARVSTELAVASQSADSESSPPESAPGRPGRRHPAHPNNGHPRDGRGGQ